MKLNAFTDGASRGNPGDAAIGIVIKSENGATISTKKRYLGTATNNVAEYTALVECIELVHSSETFNCTELVVHTDSELMARQLNGQYKVKDAGLKVLFNQVKAALAGASFTFSIRHVPRSLNKEADALANEAIDSKP
ncbi:MAG: ribonuclease HI family protein [Bacteriovoracaceae bacterium]|nr:ribonuclease HI family protein [Bacteroidota bacterium]